MKYAAHKFSSQLTRLPKILTICTSKYEIAVFKSKCFFSNVTFDILTSTEIYSFLSQHLLHVSHAELTLASKILRGISPGILSPFVKAISNEKKKITLTELLLPMFNKLPPTKESNLIDLLPVDLSLIAGI